MVVPWLAELSTRTVKPKTLDRTAALASATTMRVRTTFMTQPFPALAGHEPSLTLLSVAAVKSILEG
jgi:hypothetical protein